MICAEDHFDGDAALFWGDALVAQAADIVDEWTGYGGDALALPFGNVHFKFGPAIVTAADVFERDGVFWSRRRGGGRVAVVLDDGSRVAVDFSGVDACCSGGAVEQYAHYAGFKAEDGDAIIVWRGICHDVVDFGHDGDGAAKGPVKPVGGMGGVIEVHADIGNGIEVPSGRASDKVGIEQYGDAMSSAHDRDISDYACVNECFNFAVDGVLPHLKGHAEFDARVIYGFDDAVAIFEGGGHGFLEQDVFARLSGHERVFCVAIGFYADHDGVDVWVAEYGVCGCAKFHAEFVGVFASAVCVVVPGGDEFGVVKMLHLTAICVDVSVCVADDANVNFVHKCPYFT